MINFNSIDKSWTLFLDRDGVINDEKHMEYVNTWEEFKFYPGALDAIKIFSQKFGRIFIVTNQRGVGKGLTNLKYLDLIHRNLLNSVQEAEGKIDKIYFCADLEDTNTHRKPNTGMGLEAKKDFPEVDFKKSIMIGNTLSDMEFGRNLGIYTVFLPTTRPEVDLNDHKIDVVFDSLKTFADALIADKL